MFNCEVRHGSKHFSTREDEKMFLVALLSSQLFLSAMHMTLAVWPISSTPRPSNSLSLATGALERKNFSSKEENRRAVEDLDDVEARGWRFLKRYTGQTSQNLALWLDPQKFARCL